MYVHAYKANKRHAWPFLHVPLCVVYMLCVRYITDDSYTERPPGMQIYQGVCHTLQQLES